MCVVCDCVCSLGRAVTSRKIRKPFGWEFRFVISFLTAEQWVPYQCAQRNPLSSRDKEMTLRPMNGCAAPYLRKLIELSFIYAKSMLMLWILRIKWIVAACDYSEIGCAFTYNTVFGFMINNSCSYHETHSNSWTIWNGCGNARKPIKSKIHVRLHRVRKCTCS